MSDDLLDVRMTVAQARALVAAVSPAGGAALASVVAVLGEYDQRCRGEKRAKRLQLPWSAEQHSWTALPRSACGWVVHVSGQDGVAPTLYERDQAQLMGAAPKLAEALEELVKMVESSPSEDGHWRLQPGSSTLDMHRKLLLDCGWVADGSRVDG